MLSAFAWRNLNLSKIESRPTKPVSAIISSLLILKWPWMTC
ncbi:hypothetical protein PO124_31420 [Bacillus licheniformis]|nr:hypothetical protein [Bacillus licheniformis]